MDKKLTTDRTIPKNKPDIIICDNEKGTCQLIDISASEDRIVIKKGAEQVLKYKKLAYVECKTKVIPVIVQGTGTISK
jgi:hypothetical protein